MGVLPLTVRSVSLCFASNRITARCIRGRDYSFRPYDLMYYIKSGLMDIRHCSHNELQLRITIRSELSL
jgi:hypothetical protein